MSLSHIAGSTNPLKTITRKSESTASETVIEISGPYASVAALQPAYGAGPSEFTPCPAGYTVVNSTITPDGRGGGVLSVRCVNYTNPTVESQIAPMKTIYNIEMVQTTYPLQQHPTLTESSVAVKTIAMWLNSSPAVQYSGETGFAYTDANGNSVSIASDSLAYKFCAAYQAGITTFNRYFPVVVKVSTWKSLPGASMSGNSQTGGTISQFSPEIGKWDDPDITLTGYPAGNWFKSGDRWNQNQDQTYTRNEQWVYTPDGASGPHGWIYESSQQAGGGAE